MFDSDFDIISALIFDHAGEGETFEFGASHKKDFLNAFKF